MTKKQKITIVGIIDLFIMICAITSLSLNGVVFYVLEAVFLILWLITSAYIYKGCKELNNKDDNEDNNFESKKNKLAKYLVLSSFIFAIVMTIIILVALR